MLPPNGLLAAGGVCALGLCGGLILQWYIRRHRSRTPKYLAEFIGISAFGLVTSFLLAGANAAGFVLGFYVPVVFASPWAAIPALTFGVTLFAVRRRWLGLYGAFELLGALVTLLIVGFTRYGSPYQRGAALLGAVYFLVRGLDNADKGQLLPAVRGYISETPPLLRWVAVSMLALMMGTLALTSFAHRPDDLVHPPYIADRSGWRLPVSAMNCGQLFVICDAAAWREHERLLSAGPAERLRAEAEAEARFERMNPRTSGKATH